MIERLRESASDLKQFCIGEELPPAILFTEAAFFQAYGVNIQVVRDSGIENILETDVKSKVHDGSTIGLISFNPFNKDDPNSTRLNTLAAGLQGMTRYFQFVDYAKSLDQEILLPDFLVGITSKDLAIIAERIGFTRVERNDGYHELLGEVGTVRESFEALMKEHIDMNGDNRILAMARNISPELWEEQRENPFHKVSYMMHPAIAMDFDVAGRSLRRSRSMKAAMIGGAACLGNSGIAGYFVMQDSTGGLIVSSIAAGSTGALAAYSWVEARKA